jgi:Phosphotransferase system mannitol/fructose-specific IIA domain (Ntr-type)
MATNNVQDPDVMAILPESTERDALLHEMADYLLGKGIVKPGYGDAVIEREKTYPTGIPTEPIAVAIPHSSRELVNKSTILVARTKSGVTFDRIDDKDLTVDVKVIFMLAIGSDDGEVEAIAKVMNAVQDEALVEQIASSEDADSIEKAFRDALAVVI